MSFKGRLSVPRLRGQAALFCDIVAGIRGRFPACAITLSVEEKERAGYQAFFDVGANRCGVSPAHLR